MPRITVLALAATLSIGLCVPAATAQNSAAAGRTETAAPKAAGQTTTASPALIGVSLTSTAFVASVEQATGHRLGVLRTFHHWGDGVSASERTMAASGHALMPSFMVPGGAGATYAQISSGRYDTWIRSSLRAYDSLGVRIWWIPQQEINRPVFRTAGTQAEAKAFLSHLAVVANSMNLANVQVTPALICARFPTTVDKILPSPYPFKSLGMIAANATYDSLTPALTWIAAHPGIRLVIPEFEGSPPPRGTIPNTRQALVAFSAWAQAHAAVLDAAAYYAGHITLSASDGTLSLFVKLANSAPFA